MGALHLIISYLIYMVPPVDGKRFYAGSWTRISTQSWRRWRAWTAAFKSSFGYLASSNFTRLELLTQQCEQGLNKYNCMTYSSWGWPFMTSSDHHSSPITYLLPIARWMSPVDWSSYLALGGPATCSSGRSWAFVSTVRTPTRSVSAVHVKPKNFNPGSPKQLLLFGSTW